MRVMREGKMRWRMCMMMRDKKRTRRTMTRI